MSPPLVLRGLFPPCNCSGVGIEMMFALILDGVLCRIWLNRDTDEGGDGGRGGGFAVVRKKSSASIRFCE